MKHIKASHIAAVLSLSGVLLLTPYVYFWASHKATLTKGTVITTPQIEIKAETLVGKPSRLIVPSLGIDIAVADGEYNPADGSWTLSEDSAHFALLSNQPNDLAGNTLIYGHNQAGVFGNLSEITAGGEAIVITDNGLKFTYRFKNYEDVEPNDVRIFEYEGEPQLTLQTCSGFWMQDRRMHYFSLVSVEKI